MKQHSTDVPPGCIVMRLDSCLFFQPPELLLSLFFLHIFILSCIRGLRRLAPEFSKPALQQPDPLLHSLLRFRPCLGRSEQRSHSLLAFIATATMRALHGSLVVAALRSHAHHPLVYAEGEARMAFHILHSRKENVLPPRLSLKPFHQLPEEARVAEHLARIVRDHRSRRLGLEEQGPQDGVVCVESALQLFESRRLKQDVPHLGCSQRVFDALRVGQHGGRRREQGVQVLRNARAEVVADDSNRDVCFELSRVAVNANEV